MSNVGFRIYSKINRPSPEVLEGFKGLPVANIADEMNRFFCMAARIRPLNKSLLLGSAFTVRVRTGDNLMLHKAIAMAESGDVIVVDAQGDLSNAITGAIMMTEACKKGLAGVIIDGAVRDLESLQELAMPVYAAGINPKGPYKDGPGEINVPISCGGIVVNPGDIVVGDADGVVVISPQDAAALLPKARAKLQKEQEIFRAIEAGTRDKTWIERELQERGCEVIEDFYRQPKQ